MSQTFTWIWTCIFPSSHSSKSFSFIKSVRSYTEVFRSQAAVLYSCSSNVKEIENQMFPSTIQCLSKKREKTAGFSFTPSLVLNILLLCWVFSCLGVNCLTRLTPCQWCDGGEWNTRRVLLLVRRVRAWRFYVITSLLAWKGLSARPSSWYISEACTASTQTRVAECPLNLCRANCGKTFSSRRWKIQRVFISSVSDSWDDFVTPDLIRIAGQLIRSLCCGIYLIQYLYYSHLCHSSNKE